MNEKENYYYWFWSFVEINHCFVCYLSDVVAANLTIYTSRMLTEFVRGRQTVNRDKKCLWNEAQIDEDGLDVSEEADERTKRFQGEKILAKSTSLLNFFSLR